MAQPNPRAGNRLIPAGPAENATFYNRNLSKSELYSRLFLRNLDKMPFRGNWDGTSAPTMAYILYYLRAQLIAQRATKLMVLPAVMAEFLGPYLSRDLFMAQGDAEEEVIRLVEYMILNVNVAALLSPDVNRAEYSATVGRPDGEFTEAAVNRFGDFAAADWPDYQAQPNARITIAQAIRILFFAANRTAIRNQCNGLDLIVYTTVAISKRGTVSEDFCRKITEGIMADLGKDIRLEPDVIKQFYSVFGPGIDDNSIVEVKNRWELLIPEDALRLKLTVRQLVGSGLTALITVGRAIRKYPDFPWGRISNMYTNDCRNYLAALRAVNGNLYYGFRKDLGVVRSTLYPNLAFIAKELLIKVGGEASLRHYRGWKARIPEQGTIDIIIGEYEQARQQQQGQAGQNAENTTDMDEIVEAVTDVENADLLA